MLERFRASALRGLSSPRARGLSIALGLVLLLPSLPSGLAADDWFHRLVLTGSNVLGGIHHRSLDLFVFSNGDPAVGHAQQESGLLGWWADPSAALAYFRPLSSATHWLDYQLFPDSPFAMHVESLAWFALGLVALSCVYRRFFEPAWYGALALLLYAIDDAHGFVVSWIANRNALIALALGLPVLLFHDRARREGDRRAGVIAPVLFFLALLAGESAVAVGGYLLSYAAFMEEAPPRRRLASVAPYAVAFVVWRVAYAALGYGTHGSGLSVDPVHDPVEFVRAVVVRLPVMLLAQLAVPPSDVWEVFPVVAPWAQGVVYASAIAVMALVVWLLWPALRRERTTRFWALGMVLSALPPCSQVPHDRLLLFVGVGGQALVARLLGAFIAREEWTVSSRLVRVRTAVAAAFLVLIHLVIAPVWLTFRARGPADVTAMLAVADRTVPSDPAVRGRTVVLVNPPADAFAGYLPMMRAGTGRPVPGRLRWLTTGASAATIERLDERTLRVSLAEGFLSLASERMQRSSRNPMPVGYTVSLSGMAIVVTAVTSDARPKEIRARFDSPLEDPNLVFLRWTPEGYVPFAIPAIGEQVTLPAVDFTKLRM
jgi:hypothetical protein